MRSLIFCATERIICPPFEPRKQNLLMKIIQIILLWFVCGTAAAPVSGQTPTNISAKKLTQRLEKLGAPVCYGGVMIAAGDTLRGPVVAVDGVLDVQDGGVLAGDAWVVNGRMILTGGAVVLGRVYLVNSEPFFSHSSTVAGGVERYKCECEIKAEVLETDGKLVFGKKEDPLALKFKPTMTPGRPTRVKYNVVRLGIARENPKYPAPYVHVFAAADVPLWPDSRGYLGFDAAVTIPLAGGRFSACARAFKKTFTNDDWLVSRGEDAAMLVLTGYEFADYYERRGGQLGLELDVREFLSVNTEVYYGRDVSLTVDGTPSVFQSNQRLPDNPAVDDGDRVAVSAAVTFDSRYDASRPRNAWFGRLRLEKGVADGPGEFSYAAFSVDACRYTEVPLGFQLDLRGKLFSSFDRLPRQVWMSLNGYGGVRGLGDDPFLVRRGDRLALFSGELRRRLPELPVFRIFFSRWDFLVFGDVGLLAKADHERSPFKFLEEKFDNWGRTAGVGISGESFLPYVGLYLAKDLDGRRDAPRIILRLNRSF